jgi:hypothetical protein
MPGVTGTAPVVAVKIGGALTGRKPVEECAFGVGGQILDDLGYCVTVVNRRGDRAMPLRER